MKQIILLFTLILSFISAFSQNGIILNSGRTFPITKLEAQTNYLDVWPSLERGVMQLPIDSVWGYYKLDADKDILRVNIPDKSQGSELEYQFLPYGLRGRINSYTYPIPFATKDDESSNYLFLQKDGQSEMIFPFSFGSTLDKSLRTFKNFISDEEEILKRVESSAYEHKYENVVKLVNDYNMLTYRQLSQPSDPKAVITFYRMKKGESKEKVRLTLDDKEFSFNRYNIHNLEVSTKNLQKLCVSSSEDENCLLIEGLPYFRLYYQVSLDKKGKVKLFPREKGEAFTDIKVIRKLN